MANETMTLISTVTVGAGGASQIEFASVPQSFTDLNIVVSSRSTDSGYFNSSVVVKLNNDLTSANYTRRGLFGQGSSVGSVSGNSRVFGLSTNANNTANTFSSNSIYIPNYTAAVNKSFCSEAVNEQNDSSNYLLYLFAGLWANTAAITNIVLGTDANFAQYTTASLYGILKGSGGATVS